jgi:F0F1-type ATP synthase membrane subunit b/b'
MDIVGRLQQLEDLVREAKSMPLSSSVLISRDEVLQMIHEMQEAMPEEIKQARWIVRDREELLEKARSDGEKIIVRAQDEQARLARHEEVSQRAERESERLLAESEDKGEQIRREAEDYVDAKLAQFENSLRRILEGSQDVTRSVSRTLDQVEVGRERLRSPQTVADQELGSGEFDQRVLDEETEHA